MRKKVWFALISVLSFSLLIRTLPLFNNALWGIDCGEYVYYTNRWVNLGRMELSIQGWGQAYPYIPGMYILGGTLHLITETSVITSTVFFPAILSSFVPLLIFVLVHRITRLWKPALLSAVFLTVLVPFVYNYSQPKPETVGYFLMLLILTGSMLIYRENRKILWMMIPASLALMVTHHFSSYFLMLFLIGGVFLSELSRRKGLKRDRVKLWFFILFATITIAFWFFFIEPFRYNRLYGALGFPSFSIVLVPYLIVIFLYLSIRLRRRYDIFPSINLHRQDVKRFVILSLIAFVVVFLYALYVSFTTLPGREIVLGPTVLLYMPIVVLSLFAIFSRKLIRVFEDGMHVLGWMLFTLLSFAAGVVSGSSSLLPMRQVAFVVTPLSILFGVGLYHFSAMYNPFKKIKKTALLSALVFLLLAFNPPLTYPSQDLANGYEERVEWEDMEACYWLKTSDGKIATDHRLSAAAFAVSNKNLTWTEGRSIYFSSNFSEALDESRELKVRYIMWDEEMKKGVTTTAGANPDPFNKILLKNYREGPCIYENEETEAYVVP